MISVSKVVGGHYSDARRGSKRQGHHFPLTLFIEVSSRTPSYLVLTLIAGASAVPTRTGAHFTVWYS